jgi:hypothetical protein
MSDWAWGSVLQTAWKETRADSASRRFIFETDEKRYQGAMQKALGALLGSL